MTKRQGKSGTIDVKALLAEDEEFLRALVPTPPQEVLEAEMTEALGAERGERAAVGLLRPEVDHTGPQKGFETLLRKVKPGGYILIGLYNSYGRLPTL